MRATASTKSQELKVFREWLRKIDSVSDSEIVEQLNDVRLKVTLQGVNGLRGIREGIGRLNLAA